MINNIKYFDSTKDLETLTGLSHNELWENGFDLDDMDWGIVSDIKFDDDSYVWFMISNHYCNVNEIKFNNQYFYTMHHA